MTNFNDIDIRKYDPLLSENPELGQYIKYLEEANKQLKELSSTDELTGLPNFRHFQEVLDLEFERAKRLVERGVNYSLSLVLFDIDDFKKYNDDFGHDKGNKVLEGMGRILKKGARKIDIPFRYGGEELGVILPSADLKGAKKFADVLRSKVEKMEAERTVTVSGGIGTYPNHDIISPIGLFEAADSSLYVAKNSGKNRICTYLDR
ncbi:MAG: GGDEF domain-containing protein [Candidatus Aenigmatarchaeota archaeon]